MPSSKKTTVDGSVKISESRSTNSKIAVYGNDAKPLVTTIGTSSEKKPKAVPTKDFLGSDEGVKSAKDTGALDGRPSKKARVDCSVRLTENRNDIGILRLTTTNLSYWKPLKVSVRNFQGGQKNCI